MNTSNQSSDVSAIFDNWINIINRYYEIFQLTIPKLPVFLKQGVANGIKIAKKEFNEIRCKLTLVDYAFIITNLLIIGFAFSVLLLGFGILGYQSALWLQDGVWTKLRLLDVFNFFFEGAAIQEWLNSPASWFGLHQIVDWCLNNIPISLTLILQGMFMAILTASFLFLSVIFRYIWIKSF